MVRTLSAGIGVARVAFICVTNVQMLWFSLFVLVGCWIAVMGRRGADGPGGVGAPATRPCCGS
jgi:hypothetical protein